MNTTKVIKYSTDEKHQKLVAFMRDWSKRKEERLQQKREDYKAGKYDDLIKRLDELNKKSDV